MTRSVIADPLSAAVDALTTATLTGRPVPPVRLLLDAADDDLAVAYAIQERLTARRLQTGRRVVGRKIGLTSLAVQRQLGVSTPDVGVLFDDMQYAPGRAIPTAGLLQPRIEAEIAFVLGSDLVDDTSEAAVRAATSAVVAAFEIVDSRIAGWDITLLDTVADNASSGGFVLGPDRHALGVLDLTDVAMTMTDHEGTVVSGGSGADCLGDPVLAVSWLARMVRELGSPLRAGEIVLSGALGPMVPVTPGSSFRAELSGLGYVEARFGGQVSA